MGFDLGAEWSPVTDLRFSVTGFYEFFRNELARSNRRGRASSPTTFNAARLGASGDRGRRRLAFAPGWRGTLAYTFDDQIYTRYTSSSARAA